MNQDIVTFEEMLDVHANRCLEHLPVAGVNLAFYDNKANKLRFRVGAGICRGPYMRSQSPSFDGPCLVLPKHSKRDPSAPLTDSVTLNKTRPVWIAKEFIRPFSEDSAIVEAVIPHLSNLSWAPADGQGPSRHKVIPPELIMETLVVRAPECFEFTNLACTIPNHHVHGWHRLYRIDEMCNQNKLELVEIFGERAQVEIKEIVAIPLVSRANGSTPSLRGLLNLDNPDESVFRVPAIEHLVFQKAFELAENLNQWVATLPVDVAHWHSADVTYSAIESRQHQKLLEAIAQIAAILENSDVDESLARAMEMQVSPSNEQLMRLHNHVVARLNAEKATIDRLAKELDLGRKRTARAPKTPIGSGSATIGWFTESFRTA